MMTLNGCMGKSTDEQLLSLKNGYVTERWSDYRGNDN